LGDARQFSDAKKKSKLFDETDKIELFKQSTIMEQLQSRMNMVM